MTLAWTGCDKPAAAPLEFHDELRAGKVVLGSASLVSGMPGDKELTPAQVKFWLQDERVHQPLKYCLPLGLHTADHGQLPELTRAKIELGRQLFFDQRMGRDAGMSCSRCHQEESFSNAIGPKQGLRNPNTVINRILGENHFWDGHAKSLRDVPPTPILDFAEMNTTPEAVVAMLQQHEGYRLQFERIFGKVDFENACDALAAFQCTLVTAPSPWDYDVVLRELSAREPGTLTEEEQELLAEARAGAEREPLSAAARRGAELFFSERTNCSSCHSGPNFTDESFHNLGVEPPNDDPGRYAITKQREDLGAFKTPTLRNVAHTHPYMHNSRFGSVEETVAWLVKGGDGERAALTDLKLTRAEQEALVEFLRSLSSSVPRPEQWKLPK
ncbi:cytochrome-c peroxidase [Anatilimnocola floriformis]|uniref:cytochrome-c peroxidase n=1 Tax=Anatilimnocola floriformis TaxID=2948575 RepID=UPI0020C1C9DF|nr:cytochrome c peroxidase [Anatilimnocola floriformis]